MLAEISWQPGVGDPTWIGWLTVAAYLIAAFFCGQAGLQSRITAGRSKTEPPWLWLVFAAGLFFLGVNKQLDLQTAFIRLGGQLAMDEGWYQYRRQVQFAFVLALGTVLTVTCGLIAFKERQFFRNHIYALLGSILLAAFVVLRAAIFSHVDDAGLSRGEGNWMHGLELAGIYCFIRAALRARKTTR